ncbi:PGPGW domain-containing protein [Paludibaculum fermentans]|uniref:PGPGW domain-containing protein n=1 Tax=Paludibaculum fermentans TaxID=1473598 RepID=UPI003EBF730E
MAKLLRILSGFGLLLLGVLGLIMPIMPGWVFLIPGLVILADYFPPIRRLLDWAKRKFEQQSGRMRDNSKTPQ